MNQCLNYEQSKQKDSSTIFKKKLIVLPTTASSFNSFMKY